MGRGADVSKLLLPHFFGPATLGLGSGELAVKFIRDWSIPTRHVLLTNPLAPNLLLLLPLSETD